MTVFARVRAARLAGALREHAVRYAELSAPERIRAWQLARFNQRWAEIRTHVPRFRDLARELDLPPAFASWDQVRASIPLTSRRILQSEGTRVQDERRPPDQWRATGGSTGEPVRLGVWSSELNTGGLDIWWARGWLGIAPSDPVFMIWGHAHMLGSGWRGRLAGMQRRVKDRALGYHRFSAYDLDDGRLRAAGAALLRSGARWVLGYSTALARLAAVNHDRAAAFRALGLRAVVATAEAFPSADSGALVADVLGAPAVMEYGAVETGPLAHQRADGMWSAFWRSYHVDGVPSVDAPGRYEVVVTALEPRCTPLVRYALGDLMPADPAADPTTLPGVLGRCNDWVVSPGGAHVHSEAFAHALRGAPGITSFQVRQEPDGTLVLRYTSPDELPMPALDGVRARLGRVAPGLERTALERTDTLQQTVAGKTRVVWRA